ncbi:MAG: hypothetical protein IPJ68_01040 [Candidatus Moraniibacteriota bacterium]|nr:MAG: hypothetical protein IPJ68_01040 [Candidatus Moranbacteria bacterium]
MQKISRIIGQWCRAHFPAYRFALDFYITALNTFEGGPPGMFGRDDASRVTETLLHQGELQMKKKRRWDCLNIAHGLTRGYAMMARFWWFEATSQQAQAKRHLKEKQALVRRLLDHNIPIPLDGVCDGALVKDYPLAGLPTLQGLMAYIEKHRRVPASGISPMTVTPTPMTEEVSEFNQEKLSEMQALFQHARYESGFEELGLGEWLRKYVTFPA